MTQFRVFPIHIRLCICEIMEIVRVSGFVIFPCITFFIKYAPTVRRLAFFSGPPMKIIVVWTRARTASRLEPSMFIAAMIQDHIHKYFDISIMHSFEQGIKISHRSKLFHDVLIIRNIVAIVFIGRGKNRIEPNHINTQTFDIIQFRNNAFQVTYPIAIAVFKTARINLINSGFFPPFSTCRRTVIANCRIY